MHIVNHWQHRHGYRTEGQHHAEPRTLRVIVLTTVAMVVELVAGTLTCSMALLADELYIATHVGALSITAFAEWHRQHCFQR